MKEQSLNPTDFYMPAEWEPHEGTWLQWPHDYKHKGLQLQIERTWLIMTEVLHQHETVHIIAYNQKHRDHINNQLAYFGIGPQNIDLHLIQTNDIWARDNGPIFVVNHNGKVALTHWRFNGWGSRFEHDLDKQVPATIGQRLSVPVFNPPLVMEGGAVEVNGQGTFMATRTSIIDRYRNPEQSQADIEAIISHYLGVRHFIWLTGAGRGECEQWGDATDSHIDIAARFTTESTVLYNWSDDETDPRYTMFATHYEELKQATTESGKALTLVPLPVPKNGVYQISAEDDWRDSRYTDAAYSNYLVANGVVLVPVFGNVYDDRAKKIIAEHFPEREIVGIDAVTMTEGGGAIHCVTQQQPLGRGSIK